MGRGPSGLEHAGRGRLLRVRAAATHGEHLMPAKTRARPRKARETSAQLKARTRKILARLEQAYPEASCALHHRSALELLVATILSAQSTDARVNMVTPALFAKYRTAAAYAATDPAGLEQEIPTTGFFPKKTQ